MTASFRDTSGNVASIYELFTCPCDEWVPVSNRLPFSWVEVTANFHNYRPHPKDGEGYIFTLCQSTPRRAGGGGAVQVSDFLGVGVCVCVCPSLNKGKNFWHQIWLDTCSDWEKNFLSRDPPPPSKGKNFWHQIWLDTCSDWGKIFCRGTPPPPNSTKLLWLRGGRYASCVHAEGLSCFF